MSETLVLTIHDLSSDGDGVGRSEDGMAVFVPFSARGDRLSVRIVEQKKRFARGEIVEIIEPGPGRVEPQCAVFGKCGGCAWQHLDYAVQVAAKQKILTDALTRIGKLELPGPVTITPSPESYGYRSRARVRVQNGVLGYLAEGSHDFVPSDTCPVLTDPLQGRWTALSAARDVPDGEWELAAGTAAKGAEDVRATRLGADAQGDAAVVLHAGEHMIDVSPGGFAQANPLLFDAITQAVWNAGGSRARLLELFCGSGFFTLEFARRFGQVLAVESNVRAVRDLRRNAERAGLANINVLPGRVEDVCAGADVRQFRPEVIVLDPPRVGLTSRGAQAVCALNAERVVYVSCNPATLARDLRVLCDNGYALTHVEGFDMFPQTPHVEALAVVRRAT